MPTSDSTKSVKIRKAQNTNETDQDTKPYNIDHRYLMDRLPLHGFYLWRHVLYSLQRRYLYYGGENLKYRYYLTPLPAVFPLQRWQPI
jgi:hypothetical protein